MTLPALALLLLLARAVAADERESPALAAGDPLPALELEDQFGERRAVDDSVRLVLFSRDMDGGNAIREALAEDGAAFLEQHAAVYVADVSGMPALVRQLMAKPAMRRRGYPMLLDENGAATRALPAEPGQATLLFLEAGRVKRIETVASAQALRAAVEPAPESAD